ncbi:Hypothetical predicted protein [Octopus vulgaris]|uniref:Reverse transcriptase domain-containing protein n=1 Tax=Octopus vulgaris TaxID=6645 RepID=A0AA36BCX8_OCTVU|nr:Hypothetical predicted protein [Octopus vulgaris]
MAHYPLFLDLTKAFDIVNFTVLSAIVGEDGCPPQFVNLFRQLYSDMKNRLNFNGSLLEPISIDNRVKQGSIAAPKLFSIYFAVTILHAFQDCNIGVYIRFRATGKVSDVKHFNAKSKTFQALLRELFSVDHVVPVAHTKKDKQAV